MTSRIIGNLARQEKALSLLAELQKEEFTHLRVLDPAQVAGLEFSIHELMRQIMRERLELRGLYAALSPQATRLREVLDHFSESDRETADSLVASIDRIEQACARQADQNYRLALGLYNQSRSSIEFIQNQLAPKKTVYSAAGRFAKAPMGPALLSGRL